MSTENLPLFSALPRMLWESAVNISGKSVKMVIFMVIGYDEILTTAYGDYMQLPPENKRHGEHYPKVTWKLTNES